MVLHFAFCTLTFSMSTKNITLGKGLGSLIPNKRVTSAQTDHDRVDISVAAQEVLSVPVVEIHPNPHQPRKHFSEQDLAGLVASVKRYGILQPLVVMQSKGGGYELVAGERRLRAAILAGMREAPVIVRNAGSLEQFELALIENIQREDLSPIERAEAFKKLMEEFGLTHEEAARRIGVSRSVFSNTLRFLRLPGEIQKSLSDGEISEGQAKVLLELKSPTAQEQVFDRIIKEGLTVEETKSVVEKVRVKSHERALKKNALFSGIAEKLQTFFGTKVHVRKKGKGGVIEIEWYDEEELEGIMERLMR